MSLINDMLRELDRRGVDSPLLPTVSRPAPPLRRRHRVIVLLVALLLAAFGGWLLQRGLAPAATTIPALTALPQSADIGSAAPASMPQPDMAQAAPSAPSPAALPAPAPAPEDTQYEVAARAALVTDSSPIRSPAKATALMDAPLASATQPAHVVSPPPAMLTASAAEPARLTPSTASPLGSLPTRDAAAVSATRDPTRPVSAIAAAAEPPALAEPLQRLSIQRHRDLPGVSHPDLADLLQQASAAQVADRDDEARQVLQQVLDRAPTQHQARLSLAGLQADHGRVDDAIALLEAGLVLAPQHAALAERLGRLRLLRGEPARAAAILAQVLPPLAEQPSHHALLALAWQQAGQPAPAARIYQSLLEHDARVGPWWLGLAMARDALGEPAAARTAFAQALRAGGLDDGVLRYVRQRITEIEANSP